MKIETKHIFGLSASAAIIAFMTIAKLPKEPIGTDLNALVIYIDGFQYDVDAARAYISDRWEANKYSSPRIEFCKDGRIWAFVGWNYRYWDETMANFDNDYTYWSHNHAPSWGEVIYESR